MVEVVVDRDELLALVHQLKVDFEGYGALVNLYIRRVNSLFDAIAHGDEKHRAWLKEAIERHMAGLPVPEVR